MALQKTLLPRGFLLHNGEMKKTMRENVMMVAGGGCKKSFFIKKLLNSLKNSMVDKIFPGIMEILKEVGMLRKVPDEECGMCKMCARMGGRACREVGVIDVRDWGIEGKDVQHEEVLYLDSSAICLLSVMVEDWESIG